MNRKRVVRPYFNRATGEELVLEHEEDVAPRRRPVEYRSKEPFGFAFAGGFAELAKMGLTAAEWQVVAYLMSASPMSSEPAKHPTVDIAAFLGLHPQAVSRTITKLRKRGVVLIGEGGTRSLSPEYFWRGTVRDRMEALRRLGLVIEKEK